MNKPRDAGASVPADLHFLTLAQASRLLETKALSPVDYVTALIARIDALDGQLNALITRTNDVALKRAGANREQGSRAAVIAVRCIP